MSLIYSVVISIYWCCSQYWYIITSLFLFSLIKVFFLWTQNFSTRSTTTTSSLIKIHRTTESSSRRTTSSCRTCGWCSSGIRTSSRRRTSRTRISRWGVYRMNYWPLESPRDLWQSVNVSCCLPGPHEDQAPPLEEKPKVKGECSSPPPAYSFLPFLNFLYLVV